MFATDLAAGLRELEVANEVVALAPGQHGDLLALEALGPRRRSLATLRALRRRARDVDVVVAHGSATLLASAVALLGTGTPFVYRQISDPLHWAASWPRRLRVGLMIRRARTIVALSPSVAAVLCSHYRLRDDRITVIPNAVPSAPFRAADAATREEIRQELGVPVDAPVALYVGALAPEKGVDMVVRAVGAVEGAWLVVVGDGPERDDLVALADEVVEGRCVFTGSLESPVAALQGSDVLVLASRAGDSMPAVLIEGGLCGLPSVTTPVGAITDVVVDGETGRVVPVGDQRALDEAVSMMLGDADLTAELGRRAAARCRERFTIEATAPAWLAVLSAASRR